MRKIAVLLLLASNSLLSAQTGLFIYGDTVNGRPHVQINDLKEGSDKNIYAAAEAKDQTFKVVSPNVMQIDLKGNLISKAALNTEVEEIKRLIVASEKKNMIYGNKNSSGGTPQSYSALLTKAGDLTTINVMAMSYAMILGDALPLSETQTLVVQSNYNKETGVFNIALVKNLNEDYYPQAFATLKSDYSEIPSQAILNNKKEIFITGYRLMGKKIETFIYALNSKGEKLWDANLDFGDDFQNISLGLDKKGNVLVVAGYRESGSGKCHSVLQRVDDKGKNSLNIELEGIKVNGILTLKNGEILLYGTNFQYYEMESVNYVVSHGGFMLFDESLQKIIKSDEVSPDDTPLANSPNVGERIKTTSSEFNTGIQLSDGRIVLGGRMTYPILTEGSSDQLSFNNQACVLFMTEKANFRKSAK